jgi:hypothetical protein
MRCNRYPGTMVVLQTSAPHRISVSHPPPRQNTEQLPQSHAILVHISRQPPTRETMSSAESIASEAIENFISAEQRNNMPSEEPMTPPTYHEGCMSTPQPQNGYIDGEALSNRLDNPVPIMYQPTLPKNGDSLSDILNKYPAPIEFQQYLESIDDRSHIIGLFMNVVYGPVGNSRIR